MSRLLLTLPMTLLALSAGAEPTPDACEARAARVVAQLEQEAVEPLSRKEAGLARRAALAACQGRYTPPESTADEAASPATAGEAGPGGARGDALRALRGRSLRPGARGREDAPGPQVPLHRQGLARISHQTATAAAHLGALTGDISLRVLDVASATPPLPSVEIARHRTHLHHLATRPGAKCGLAAG